MAKGSRTHRLFHPQSLPVPATLFNSNAPALYQINNKIQCRRLPDRVLLRLRYHSPFRHR